MTDGNERPGRWRSHATVITCLVACLAAAASCGDGGAGGNGEDPGGGNGGGNGEEPVPLPPSVTTLSSQMVSAAEETLAGSINPNGKETEYWFEWGADEGLTDAARTAPGTLAASTTAQPVTAKLTGLEKGAHFHYRLCARNADGTVEGEVKACNHYASVVFVTSARGTGDLGSWTEAGGKTGLAAGDAICQSLADRAGLQGPFKAWLSDTSTAARDRLVHSAEPYVRADGARVAACWSGLVSGPCVSGARPCLENPIAIDERGASAPPAAVYTNTGADGSRYAYWPSSACANWTSGSDADWAIHGMSLSTDQRWTVAELARCGPRLPLYCFQQNLDVPQEPFSTGCAWSYRFAWHVSACSNGPNQDPECMAICCSFWVPTRWCSRAPAYVGPYAVTSCRRSPPGVYSMGVTHADHAFTVSCRTWEPTASTGSAATVAAPPPGLRDRLRLLLGRASGRDGR